MLIVLSVGLSACKNIPTKSQTIERSSTETSIIIKTTTETDSNFEATEVNSEKIVVKKDSFTDKDAFVTYVGKTLEEIEQFAPNFEKEYDTVYLVEQKEDSSGIFIILVGIDDSGVCHSVTYTFDPKLLATYGIYDFRHLLDFGIERMGLSNHEIISELVIDKFDNNWRRLSENILCFTEKHDSGAMTLTCDIPNESKMAMYDTLYKRVYDRNITLVSSTYSGDTLIATLLVENVSDQDISVIYSDFEAKNGEFEVLKTDYNCDRSALIDTIVPGDKLKTNICFANAKDTPVTIYYRPHDGYQLFTFTVE